MTSSTTTSNVARAASSKFQRGLAGVDDLYLVALRFQVETQTVGQVLLVLYDE